MPKLTDTQRSVLEAAAAREDRAVLPMPASLKGGAAKKVLDALSAKGLIEEASKDGLRVTDEGLRAVGIEADDARKAVRTRPGTKQAALIDLLRRAEGATIAQMRQATGWQAHTCRGAMSGVLGKKLGLTITSVRNDAGERVYRITDEEAVE